MPAELSGGEFARQTQTPLSRPAQEVRLLKRRGLVPGTQFFALQAILCPWNRLEAVWRNFFTAGLAFAVSAPRDALECIVDLLEHAAANARCRHVDVLLNAPNCEFHFVGRLNG